MLPPTAASTGRVDVNGQIRRSCYVARPQPHAGRPATIVSPGLTGSVRSVEAEQESLYLRLRRLTLLVLLTPPVPDHAPRLVHRQHYGHEQHQQAAASEGCGKASKMAAQRNRWMIAARGAW
jgi:hypothetical protein